MIVKSIETEYRGFTFRSRTEARWAMLFDLLGIEWDYEPEGYILGDDGTFYVPDFWLPEFECFAEIKGQAATDEERRKCELLRDEIGKAVLLLQGQPHRYDGELFAWAYQSGYSSNTGGTCEHSAFLSTIGNVTYIVDVDCWHDPGIHVTRTEKCDRVLSVDVYNGSVDVYYNSGKPKNNRLLDAVEQVRRHRFWR